MDSKNSKNPENPENLEPVLQNPDPEFRILENFGFEIFLKKRGSML